MELKTPLYETHLKYGGKVVPFAGYLLPIQYEGIIAEHTAVRTACGLFDVSHMGEVKIIGKDALANIQRLVCNDCSGMYDGQVRYSPMCNENGGVVDDLLVYRVNEQAYLIVINAANHDKDVAWMSERIKGEAQFEDISAQVAQLALQGPKAADIISKLTDEEKIPQKNYSFKRSVKVGSITCLLSRTGYTGEDGFELYTAPADAPALWEELMQAGKEFGLAPCGLGARDTLRLEAAMPLYGHEMDDTVTPLETGLGFFVKLGKDDFIGKRAMVKAGEPKRERIGVELVGRGIARQGDPVIVNSAEIGKVTSGTMCPFVKKAVAMALVEKGKVNVGDSIAVEVRGKAIEAVCVKLPFYKRTK